MSIHRWWLLLSVDRDRLVVSITVTNHTFYDFDPRSRVTLRHSLQRSTKLLHRNCFS